MPEDRIESHELIRGERTDDEHQSQRRVFLELVENIFHTTEVLTDGRRNRLQGQKIE